jgi:hypothetical protein
MRSMGKIGKDMCLSDLLNDNYRAWNGTRKIFPCQQLTYVMRIETPRALRGDDRHPPQLHKARRRPMNPSDTSISALARRTGVPPQVLSNLFYRRVLDDQQCPVVNGRRVIPAVYVTVIERVLRERGLMRKDADKGDS